MPVDAIRAAMSPGKFIEQVATHPCVLSDVRTTPEISCARVAYAADGARSVTIGFHLIAVVTSGVCRVSVEGGVQDYGLEPGDALLLHPGAAFGCRWTSSTRWSVLCLDARLVRNVAHELGLAHCAVEPVVGTKDPVYYALMTALTAEPARKAHPGQRLLVQSVARACASHLLASCTCLTDQAPPSAGLSGSVFSRVRRYIEEHVDQRISLDDLASIAGVSRFHFARQFRRRTGRSPMDYLLRIRIERAKAMLVTREWRVVDVAAALGFADQSHFTRTFRKMVGTSPSSFAALNRQSA
jgi:AraC family transcriptional regulator